MKTLLLAVLCLAPAIAFANETAAPAPAAGNGVPVETVKVTDQDDQPLFQRIRDTYLRAEKKGLVATVSPETSAR